MEESNFQSNRGIIYFFLLCFVSFFKECIMICYNILLLNKIYRNVMRYEFNTFFFGEKFKAYKNVLRYEFNAFFFGEKFNALL